MRDSLIDWPICGLEHGLIKPQSRCYPASCCRQKELLEVAYEEADVYIQILVAFSIQCSGWHSVMIHCGVSSIRNKQENVLQSMRMKYVVLVQCPEHIHACKPQRKEIHTNTSRSNTCWRRFESLTSPSDSALSALDPTAFIRQFLLWISRMSHHFGTHFELPYRTRNVCVQHALTKGVSWESSISTKYQRNMYIWGYYARVYVLGVFLYFSQPDLRSSWTCPWYLAPFSSSSSRHQITASTILNIGSKCKWFLAWNNRRQKLALLGHYRPY